MILDKRPKLTFILALVLGPLDAVAYREREGENATHTQVSLYTRRHSVANGGLMDEESRCGEEGESGAAEERPPKRIEQIDACSAGKKGKFFCQLSRPVDWRAVLAKAFAGPKLLQYSRTTTINHQSE